MTFTTSRNKVKSKKPARVMFVLKITTQTMFNEHTYYIKKNVGSRWSVWVGHCFWIRSLTLSFESNVKSLLTKITNLNEFSQSNAQNIQSPIFIAKMVKNFSNLHHHLYFTISGRGESLPWKKIENINHYIRF